ncbi:hypothetical protein CYMTET_42101 [Cymbomonas tetramitiformis]|uniref:Uncharacterized protein n=1 Tax=Cymbomonas tetramitiformis TaxID=36881 RepID=A0AAE0C6H7_9CHLO|nr:hypothetical protein CYMTET_42101 [Cymbomonas tetramitiformis]
MNTELLAVRWCEADCGDSFAFTDYALLWKDVDGQFHGRNARRWRFGRPLDRFAAKPVNERGNLGQQHSKKENAHHVSFHVASNAFIPE